MSPSLIELPPTIMRKEYQIDALCGVVDQWDAGHHATMLVMPTGTGKTITSGINILYGLENYGHSTLFIAHRSELIKQAFNTFVNAFGFATAIEMGDSSEREFVKTHGRQPEVVVGTVQSLYEDRLMRRFEPNRFSKIIIDECHHSLSKSYLSVLDYFKDYYLLGITATPDGASGNLKKVYGSIAYQLRMRKAMEMDPPALVRPLIRRVPVPVNLREIRTTGGDFNVGDLAERIGPAIEILCEQIHAHIAERKTVIFTPDVGSAQAIARMLQQMGRKADYVAGEAGKFGMPKSVREARLERLKNGELQVIVSCDLLVEGWDMPSISCVVIARPTRKRYKYVQMVGRGLRNYPGKLNCLVLDLDWQQDESSRELCMPHCLFDEGDTSTDALDILASRNRERSRSAESRHEDIDILKELREVESDIHHARIIQVKYTGKHKELYQCIDKSPFGVGKVLDISVRKSKDFDPYKCGPASPFQVQRLQSLGVEGAEKMNLWGASRLISKLESREKKGLASHQQVQQLLSKGVREDQARTASKKEAAAIIAEHMVKQGEMF